MRMTSFEAPFDQRAVNAMLGRLRIDRGSLDYAIRRTVAELAGQPLPRSYKPAAEPAAPKPRKAKGEGVAASNGHPGTIPETWQEATAQQIAWWRERYSWHSTLFMTRFPSRSPAEMHDVVKRADAYAARIARARGPKPVKVLRGDVELIAALKAERRAAREQWERVQATPARPPQPASEQLSLAA